MPRILQLAAVGLLVGCQTGAPAPRLPDDVHWVRNSAEHRAVFHQIYRLATRRLEELARGREPGSWAVVLDSDETVLDNSEYEKELHQRGEVFGKLNWAAWVGRQAAPPLPGVVSFLERAHELGGRIAIVTSRAAELCSATKADFRIHGIPFDVILCGSAGQGKGSRYEQVRRGEAAPGLPPVEILLWIGDNILDFPGLDQELRHRPKEAFEGFGERFFILPNPMYGSWARNPRK
jgi:5'-nucleotidase (lipoprotein e(P4) family)